MYKNAGLSIFKRFRWNNLATLTLGRKISDHFERWLWDFEYYRSHGSNWTYHGDHILTSVTKKQTQNMHFQCFTRIWRDHGRMLFYKNLVWWGCCSMKYCTIIGFLFDFYPRPAEGRRVLSSSRRLSVRPSVTHDYTVNFPTQSFRDIILCQKVAQGLYLNPI